MNQLEALRVLQERLAAQVRSLTAMSEHGVLNAGAALQSIVLTSQRHRAQLAEDLGALEDHAAGLEQSGIHSLRGGHKALLAHMESLLQERTALVSQCESMLRELRRQSQHLDGIAGASKIMTLLARVESAHIGEEGHLFVSTVEEMAALDTAMAELTRDLVRLQEKLKTAIPVLRESSNALASAIDAYRSWWPDETDRIEALAKQLSNSSRGAARAAAQRAEVLNEATLLTLSHLQFQDPMVQDLQQLDVQISRVRTQLTEDDGDAAASFQANLGMDAFAENRPAEPSEVLMFDDDEDDDEIEDAEAQAGDLLLF